jgi:hypothetical protein
MPIRQEWALDKMTSSNPFLYPAWEWNGIARRPLSDTDIVLFSFPASRTMNQTNLLFINYLGPGTVLIAIQTKTSVINILLSTEGTWWWEEQSRYN